MSPLAEWATSYVIAGTTAAMLTGLMFVEQPPTAAGTETPPLTAPVPTPLPAASGASTPSTSGGE